jgi:transposase
VERQTTTKLTVPKKVMTLGTTVTFMEIARQTQLLQTLQNCFPTKWELLLSTAFYMLSQGNVMAYIEDWFDVTKVSFIDRFSDVVCSRLFASLTEEEMHLFFTEWMTLRKEQEHIIYDVTSVSSYSQNIDILEYGYNRDGDNLPQLNFGLFYGMTSRMPVYYQIYNGSIPDKSSFQYMMLNANDVGIQNVSVVFDKGSVTQDNINFMYENNYSFITAMSCSGITATDLIDEVKGTVEKRRNWIKDYGVFGVQRTATLYGRNIQAHIFFSNEKRAHELKVIDSQIDRLAMELEKVNNSKYVTKKFKEIFNVTEHSKSSLTFTEDEDKIDLKMSRAGYFILLCSNPDLSSQDVLNIYRNKDIIEKNFDQFKNPLDFRRIKTHYNQTTEGKFFVGFLALILRAYMSQIIRKNKNLRKHTFEKVLLELKKIRIATMSSNQEILMPLTKTQKEILAGLNVNADLLK